jgi:hypothetical protein
MRGLLFKAGIRPSATLKTIVRTDPIMPLASMELHIMPSSKSLGVVRNCHMLVGVEVERCHVVSAEMRTREMKGMSLVLGRSGEDAYHDG